MTRISPIELMRLGAFVLEMLESKPVDEWTDTDHIIYHHIHTFLGLDVDVLP